VKYLEDRIPVWPPDMTAVLYGRISNPEWKVPWYDSQHFSLIFGISPSFAYGRLEPLQYLSQLTTIYSRLADSQVNEGQKRAENAIISVVKAESQIGPEFLRKLPLGVASPLVEAARTCQLCPPGDWSTAAYNAIGRNDLAASANYAPDMLVDDGYRPPKYYIVRGACPNKPPSDVLPRTPLVFVKR
jgi:anaphase-promoting complex subunit 1